MKSQKKKIRFSMTKLVEAHQREADKHGAEIFNLGWGQTETGIASKTSAGVLETQFENGKYVNSWPEGPFQDPMQQGIDVGGFKDTSEALKIREWVEKALVAAGGKFIGGGVGFGGCDLSIDYKGRSYAITVEDLGPIKDED